MADGRRRAGRLFCAGVLPATMLAAGCSANSTAAPPSGSHSATTTVEVSTGGCGKGWTSADARGGVQRFRLNNTGDLPVQADLVDPRTGAVFAEAEGIGPGTSRSLELDVGRGRYAFRCIPADGSPGMGPTVTISSGPGRGTAGVVPVTPAELLSAVRSYTAYARAGLARLHTSVERLDAAVRAADPVTARRCWLDAHLQYESLGAAYGAFGHFAAVIDGIRTDDRTPHSGFHRVEFLLWHGAPMREVRTAVTALARDVAALQADFPNQRIDSNDLVLRAHEILEASVQFELTGASDEGSGTNLATVDANITGTQAVLAALEPALRHRYSKLPQAHAALTRLRSLLRDQHHKGKWTPVEQLARAERQRINAAAGAALELLAPVATIAAVRQTE